MCSTILKNPFFFLPSSDAPILVPSTPVLYIGDRQMWDGDEVLKSQWGWRIPPLSMIAGHNCYFLLSASPQCLSPPTPVLYIGDFYGEDWDTCQLLVPTLVVALLINTLVIIIRKNTYGKNYFNPYTMGSIPFFKGHSVAMILAPPPLSPDTKYALRIGRENPSLDSQILEDIPGRGSPVPFWSNQQKPILSVEAVIIRRAATISNVWLL